MDGLRTGSFHRGIETGVNEVHIFLVLLNMKYSNNTTNVLSYKDLWYCGHITQK